MHGIAPAWASLRRRISVVGSFRGMSGTINSRYYRIGILYVFCEWEDF